VDQDRFSIIRISSNIYFYFISGTDECGLRLASAQGELLQFDLAIWRLVARGTVRLSYASCQVPRIS
jgi:hypothetical protein